MTKKFFQGLFAFFVAAVLSVGFVSCNDDDETPEPAPSGPTASAPSIVGTWKWEQGNNSFAYVTFKADGTGIWYEFYNGKFVEFLPLSYNYNEESNNLVTTYLGGETDAFKVRIVSQTQVEVSEYNGNHINMYWNKVDSSFAESSLFFVGTWRYDGPDGSVLITLNSNGTGEWKEFYQDGYKKIESFVYKYNSETIVIFISNGQRRYSVNVISPTEVEYDGRIFIKQ